MTRRTRTVNRAAGGLVIIVGLLFVASAPSASAAPPAKRTYFTVFIGLDEPYSWQADCLRFSKREVCTSDRACGAWVRTEKGPAGAFSYEIELAGYGVPIRIDGQARVETRGKQDTIGGTSRAEMEDQSYHFSLTGRSTKHRKCLRLMERWERGEAMGGTASSFAVGRPKGR
jgi:hypothetical protein